MFANASATPLDRPGSARWWRDRRRAGARAGRPRPNGLSLARICDAATAVIEEEGLEAVTMRRLAERLATGPAALYRHVSGRDELLVLMTDRLLEVDGAPIGRVDGWRDGCELIARSFRKVLMERPALAILCQQGQMLGPNALRGREQVLRWLLDQGFSPSLAARTYLLLTRYVIGSLATYGRSSKREAQERKELVRLFAELDQAEFPTLTALAKDLGGQSPEAEFDFGLTALLDGIGERLAAEGRQ